MQTSGIPKTMLFVGELFVMHCFSVIKTDYKKMREREHETGELRTGRGERFGGRGGGNLSRGSRSLGDK